MILTEMIQSHNDKVNSDKRSINNSDSSKRSDDNYQDRTDRRHDDSYNSIKTDMFYHVRTT